MAWPFVLDDSVNVAIRVKEIIAKLGENISPANSSELN